MSDSEFSFHFNKTHIEYKVWLAAVNPTEFKRIIKTEDLVFITVSQFCDGIVHKLNETVNCYAPSTTEIQNHIRSFIMAAELTIGLVCVYEQQVKLLLKEVTRCIISSQYFIGNLRFFCERQQYSSSKADKSTLKRKRRPNFRKVVRRMLPSTTHSIHPLEHINEIQNQTVIEILKNDIVSDNADISIQESNDDSYLKKMNYSVDVMDIDFGKVVVNDEHEHLDIRQDGLLLREQSSNTGHIEGEVHVLDHRWEVEILNKNTNEVYANKVHNSKRKHSQPFKDRILNINIHQNRKTSITTQRHLSAKEDCFTRDTRIKHLFKNLFENPTHMFFLSKSFFDRYNHAPISSKLLKDFKRMTIIKAEVTDHDIVNGAGLSESSLPLVKIQSGLDYTTYQVPLQSQELSRSQPTLIEPERLLFVVDVEPTVNYQNVAKELSPVILQLLSTEAEDSYIQCDTNSQKIFALKSRKNRLDWGKEGVLRKLLALWNSGIDPIGMKEIMQSKNQRISAATAFYSVMELNSARIGLIDIDKSPDSNTIYNITRSPKFIELQHT